MLLINLDAKHQGIAIVNGVPFRVTGKYGMRGETIYPYTSNRRAITIELVLNDTLDEEQQRLRIANLERDLQNEREKLEEIRRTVTGEDDSEDMGR